MIVAVSNPAAGHRLCRDRLRAVERICAEAGRGLEVVETTGPRDVVRAAGEAASRRPELVVLIGGDGSAGELCRAYADLEPHARPPVVLVPAGRGNSLYKTLLSDAPWPDYLRRTLERSYVGPVDAARVVETGDVWVLGFSVGYLRHAIDAARLFRGLRGRTLYGAGGAYAAVRPRPFAVEVAVDDRAVYAGRSVLVAVGGGAFWGGRLLLFPVSDLSDGLLDVAIVEDMPARRFAHVLRRALTGHHVDLDDVHVFQGTDVRITAPEGMHAELDGTGCVPGPRGVTLRPLPGLLPMAFPRGEWEADLIEPRAPGL